MLKHDQGKIDRQNEPERPNPPSQSFSVSSMFALRNNVRTALQQRASASMLMKSQRATYFNYGNVGLAGTSNSIKQA
jgi:hypothetical protein